MVVRSQHERAVAEDLTALGYESFVPLYTAERRWSDRIKQIRLPLFSRYTFGRFPYMERVRVLGLPGVRSLVSFGQKLAPIPDKQIEALKMLAASGAVVQPWPFLRSGDRVRIERGPLREVEGVIVKADDSFHLVVSIDMLQRSVAVQLDRDMVTPVRR